MTSNSMRCVHCHAYVLWARTTTGGVMPVNWKRDDTGNVILVFEPGTDKPLGLVAGPADTLSANGRALPRHTLHYDVCPESWAQRKARR